ncbi:hypothetical protein DOK78_002278 [Enterococcus sp. DIV2402]|uniref:DUF4234 domain-containing protein n=1 Tax=Candidatus Enterococcus lowellii TaxID=2230877 RepID=A0ABZ2SPD1_9ENTE|nr:DUF4234 domain-containing protein [Enterococcus sp. DIV2402]MBO0463602.1 DUF4234 domain-containing protein [Enterococcus sp. DIV2402]
MQNRRLLGRERSVLLVVVLTLITCGIYFFVWMYQVTKELTEYTEDYRLSPGLAVVFTLLTCGFYTLYWWYRINNLMMTAQHETGYQVMADNKWLFLLCSVVGFSIINMAIIQSDLNLLWERAEVAEEPPIEETPFQSSDDEWTDY